LDLKVFKNPILTVLAPFGLLS